MRRASPGRAARIVIALMAAHCARFCPAWGGGNGGAGGSVRNAPRWTRRPSTLCLPHERCRFYVLGAPGLAALLSTMPPGQAAKPKRSLRPSLPRKRRAEDTIARHGRGVVGLCLGDKTGRICYLVGRPQKTDSAGIGRKAPVAMVTHRPSENISNVVSFVEGYSLKRAATSRSKSTTRNSICSPTTTAPGPAPPNSTGRSFRRWSRDGPRPSRALRKRASRRPISIPSRVSPRRWR